MAVTSAVSDLFSSFYELLASVVGAMYTIVQTIVMAVVNFITGIVSLAGNILGGVVDVAGGVGKFLIGNIFVIGVVALGAFAYFRYTTQGRQVAAGKKTA